MAKKGLYSKILFAAGVVLLTVMLGGASAIAPPGADVNPGIPWPAVDDLERILSGPADVGPPKPNRFVGIFYFLWLGHYGQPELGPFDVSRILAEFPNALQTPTSPPWGPEHHPHFWGEPLS